MTSEPFKARYLPVVARLIMPPPAGTAKNWAAYRARFIEPDRVRAGAAFWAANARWLDEAEARYGVPPAIVVGIIGVETFYGRVTGNFRVLDALATLALDFPKGRKDRSEFFRDELGQFLKLVHAEQLPATAVKGSFAGAIGLGQFMPGSINRFAVDFDGDGHIDMASSAALRESSATPAGAKAVGPRVLPDAQRGSKERWSETSPHSCGAMRRRANRQVPSTRRNRSSYRPTTTGWSGTTSVAWNTTNLDRARSSSGVSPASTTTLAPPSIRLGWTSTWAAWMRRRVAPWARPPSQR